MSHWVLPTTADIGIRAFAQNPSELFREVTLGMQSILLTDDFDINEPVRKTAQWEVHGDLSDELLLVKWLDEVLFNAEVNEQFLVDLQPMLSRGKFAAQVSYVACDEVETEIEIKAVTTHELKFSKVNSGETINSDWETVPSFEGPGWYADVVFDI